MGLIHIQRAAPKTNMKLIAALKLTLKSLVFLKRGEVLPEIGEGHPVHCAVRQVDLVGTFLTDGLVLDPGCQQAGRRVAADGA